jgi:hypothetical protein
MLKAGTLFSPERALGGRLTKMESLPFYCGPIDWAAAAKTRDSV